MFCRNCGHKIGIDKKFCSECGTELTMRTQESFTINKDTETWWKRFIKVIYIVLHIPLPLIMIGVWIGTSSSYDYFSNTTRDSYGKASFYVVLSLIVYVVFTRLIKLAYQYVVLGNRPDFKKEFKRFY